MSQRKEEIIASAIKLFNEKSCIKTTTRHICEDLNISVGNLYYYFKDKEEIIIYILEKFMKDLGSLFTKLDINEDLPFDFYMFLLVQREFEEKYRFLRLEMANLILSYSKVKTAFQEGIKLKKIQLKYLATHQIKHKYITALDEKELDFFISNTWIIGSQWEIYWLLGEDLDDNTKFNNGILNLLYHLKPYLSKKGLEESNLLESIKYLQKDENESL